MSSKIAGIADDKYGSRNPLVKWMINVFRLALSARGFFKLVSKQRDNFDNQDRLPGAMRLYRQRY